MTQAQIDLQKQLEQATADLTTRPLLNDSPVLYIDTSEQTPSNSFEQKEHTKIEHDTSKIPTPPDDTDRTHVQKASKLYKNYGTRHFNYGTRHLKNHHTLAPKYDTI